MGIIVDPGSTIVTQVADGESISITTRERAVLAAVSGMGYTPGTSIGLVSSQTKVFGPYAAGTYSVTATGDKAIVNNVVVLGVPDIVSGIASVPAQSYQFAAIGDSLTYQNTYGNAITTRAIGFMTWASILSEGRIGFKNDFNFGVSGETTGQILARLPNAIMAMKAAGIKFCSVHGGTNDISSVSPVIPASQIVANLTACYRLLLADGITPIGFPITPRSYQMTTTITQRHQQANDLLRKEAQNIPGVILFDPTLALSDPSLSDGSPIGGTPPTGNTAPEILARTVADTVDGLHWAPRGAFKVGYRFFKAVEARLTKIPQICYSAADLYNATENPIGSMMLNPMMQGTAGTLGAGATGVVATSWTMARQTGTTGAAVCSKGTFNIDDDNIINTQILQMTATAGSATEIFRFYQLASNAMPVGSQFFGAAHVTVSGIGADSLRYVKLIATDGTVVSTCCTEATGCYLSNKSWAGVMETPVAVATTANTQLLRLEIALDGTVSGNAVTVTVRQAVFRRVFY